MTNCGAKWNMGDEMVKLIIGVAGAVAIIVVLVAAIGLITGRFLQQMIGVGYRSPLQSL